jgi:hypothetical protein
MQENKIKLTNSLPLQNQIQPHLMVSIFKKKHPHHNLSGYDLKVEPTLLNNDEFLARCEGWEIGIQMKT